VITLMEGTRGSWIAGIPHVPTWLHLRSSHSLDLVEPSSHVACDSVLLVENLDEMRLVHQIRFQWDGAFDNNICRRLQTSFELKNIKHIVHPQ
jgi:hypothetical protein